MLRRTSTLLAGLSLFSFAAVASAECLSHRVVKKVSRHVHEYGRDVHRNICWPEPFLAPDRAAVYDPFAAMVHNGWRRQNLMGNHHFSPETGELTKAGELKVKWILTQVPPRYRTIYVQRGPDSVATEARIDAVNALAADVLPPNVVANVTDTHIVAEGRPADVVDYNNVRFREAAPAPALPAGSVEQ